MPETTTYLFDTNVISRIMKDGQGQDANATLPEYYASRIAMWSPASSCNVNCCLDWQGVHRQYCRRHMSVKWNSYHFYRSRTVFHPTTPNCEPIWSKPVHPSARMARLHRVPGVHVENWLQASP